MQKHYLLLIACFFTLTAYAQRNGTIRGTVTDTISGQPVASATITLFKKADSSLVSFTMTDNKGAFQLAAVPNGNYRLLITHVKYHSTSRPVTIAANTPDLSLPNIVLYDLSRTLDEVVVNGEAPPVTLIGDTVQYNAGSFSTPPNASVEQLLKKMPGIQVDKDGTVKAQGQKVNRVLVDGKEFFGTDPKMATKNLPADAVEKVQVYDKLSDAAQLTGFDDGNSEKTINLKLKKDKKKGMFGKVTAGIGTDNRYEGRGNVNSFRGARQLSLIGMGNNSNAEGFSFMDLMNFSGELNRMRNGNGNSSFSLNTDEPMGALTMGGNNNGIKTIWGGGINYNNIIGNKTDLNSSYFYNRYNPHQESNIQRQYFLPDSSYFYNQHTTSDNLNNSHRLNLGADIPIDSFHSLKITSSAGYQETRNKSYSTYETLGEDLQATNRGFSDNTSTGHGTNFRNDLLFRKKFHQKGRTLSLGLQTSINNSENNNRLFSVNDFYKRDASQSTHDSINQTSNVRNDLKSYTARIVYTEPIFRHSLLEFGIGHSNTGSTADKITYDYNSLSGKFDHLNEDLTNNFENTYGYTNAGLRLRTKQKRYSLAAGINWQHATLEGNIVAGIKDSVIRKTFNNLLPSLRFQYDFSRYRHLNVNYAALTNQPNVSQLQPVPDISDPLNIKEGNPDLQQEYTHAVQLSYMSVDPFRNKNLFAFFNLQETQHKIVDYHTVDSSGVKHTMPVNVNGVYNMTGNINWGIPVHALKGNVNIRHNMGYSKTEQFINTVSNTIRSFTLGPSASLNMDPTKKLALSVSAGINYYNTAYSLQPALNTKYFSQLYEGEIDWELATNFHFNSNFTYSINNRRADGFNTSVPLWNASISRQFLRFNRGELKLRVSDILNRNVGISRSSNQNYIEDSRTMNLQRFFLLSFTYSLSKNSSNAPKSGGINIIRH